MIEMYVISTFSISQITESLQVSPKENAQMRCVIDANPIKDETAKWSRSGFDSSRMKESRDGNAFYLTVLNVTEEDAGEFTCTVKNGIGKEAANKTYLLVKRKLLNIPFLFIIYIKLVSCLTIISQYFRPT